MTEGPTWSITIFKFLFLWPNDEHMHRIFLKQDILLFKILCIRYKTRKQYNMILREFVLNVKHFDI